MAAAEQEQTGGKLVALEGDIDTISTQLLLLPPSQKILVVPSLLDNLPQIPAKDSFDARELVRDVHAAFTERTETARAFLQSSTSAHPKLVFMNGGSVSAHTMCIAKICENITNGEIVEAETVFNEIVKDGVAGLMKQGEAVQEEDQNESTNIGSTTNTTTVEEGVEDPSLRAMKAADSLDRETAALQSESDVRTGENLAGNTAIGILEIPKGSPQNQRGGEAQGRASGAKESVFTNQHCNEIVRTVVTMPGRHASLQEKRGTFGPRYIPQAPFTAPANYSSAFKRQIEGDDDYEYDQDVVSPGGDALFSVPPTPGVIYGEACLVDVQSAAPRNSLKRVKSVDRFYPSSARFHEANLSPRSLKHTMSESFLGDRPATSGGRIPRESSYSDFQTLPKTTFVRASETTIKKSPTSSSARSSTSSATTAAPRAFVDRGTDAGEPLEKESAQSPEYSEVDPFTPVFAVVEDLIIHFSADTSNDIFESCIRSYKDESYPVFPQSKVSIEEPARRPSCASSLSSNSPGILVPTLRPTSYSTAETDDSGYHTRTEYDPYAPNYGYPPDIKQQPQRDNLERADSAVHDVEPLSPTMTPHSEPNGIAHKFIEFSPVNSMNAISVHNSLRSVLNVHFPAGENGYSQYYYAVSPKADRLWKPVFRNDDAASIGNEGRTVDQIIAFGCEEGVRADFFDQVSGQVENLGMKRSGLSRSGKLDIRYLISNIMQSFSGVLLNAQSRANPLSNPTILATLLIPQLEAYLATNTTTRLLILNYPSNHLATVFALRALLGSDLLKIAGILDSLSSDPPSILSRPRTPINPLSNDAVSSRNQSRLNSSHSHAQQRRSSIVSHISTLSNSTLSPKKSDSGLSYSKADYLLPSTATDAEIATFLSSIRKSLLQKSTFYTPEPEPKLIIIEKPLLPPTPTSVSTPRDCDPYRDSSYPPSSYRAPRETRETKISRLTGTSFSRPRTPKNGNSYAPSITSTVHTTATEKGRREDAEWEKFYIGEDDSEDDDMDRMVMGRTFAKIVPEVRRTVGVQGAPKRSTKKALKWLGLA